MGTGNLKSGGIDAMCCERLPYGKGVNRICVNVWLLAPPFNTAPYWPHIPKQAPSTLISMVAFRTCPPILRSVGSVYDFFPGVVALQLLSVNQRPKTFSTVVPQRNIPTAPFFLPRYFAFMNHSETRYSLSAQCTPSLVC